MVSCIVDTSVWIDFFRGDLRKTLLEFLTEQIQLRLAVLTDIIRHEILVGARSDSHYRELQRLLGPLECLRISEDELHHFDSFGWDLRRKGFKGKYTDSSIAFLSHRHGIPLLTLDRYFYLLARSRVIRLINLS
ncbi:MAG: PIN domain-containing protein [Deltaproteobacteria bacterium]|nr:PIN domain-containing protein [Deltaproteobacteria bacterium]MBI4373279.1 PIN domain-containing protein [Deltaproteobacteria bacterium]